MGWRCRNASCANCAGGLIDDKLAAGPTCWSPAPWNDESSYWGKGSGKSRNGSKLGKGKGKGDSHKGDGFAKGKGASQSSAPLTPRSDPVYTYRTPPMRVSSNLPQLYRPGYGQRWTNCISYIEVEDTSTSEGIGVNNRIPSSRGVRVYPVCDEVGMCQHTGYFCTGTLLNDMEMELLTRSCFVLPNGAQEGLYAGPCFRTLVTPPYARKVMETFFNTIQQW